MHPCPACGALVPADMFACKVDWFGLPTPLRGAINAAWQRRRRFPRDEGARTAHEAAKAAAVRWFRDNPRSGS